MSKKSNRRRSAGVAAHQAPAPAKASAMTFESFRMDDAVSVLDRRDTLSYLESWHNGRWYSPPISMDGLAKAFDLPGPHSSCIRLKVNLLTQHFIPSRLLTRQEFRKWALDFVSMGNGYLERRSARSGRALELQHSLSRYTRRGVKEGTYFFIGDPRNEHEFASGSVHHLIQEHPTQELYGLPEFIGSLQSALLGEAATIFRRRYYLNGSHAGFLFYVNEESISEVDANAIREALRNAKGPGNFKNLFVHAPRGKPDGIQIKHFSEVAAKDDFLNIKNVSRDDVLAAHRTPPQLVGIVPVNNAGFGNITEAAAIFHQLEILPLMSRFLEVNEFVGEEAVSFLDYRPLPKA
ncbi:MAG: phage portal protein [Novosphingobium sp.]|nr:phage portal protein [Novosphingobium sp.]